MIVQMPLCRLRLTIPLWASILVMAKVNALTHRLFIAFRKVESVVAARCKYSRISTQARLRAARQITIY